MNDQARAPAMSNRWRAAAARGLGWLARWWPHRSLGQRGEALAERHLKHLGYKIVARSVRGSLGELDLVAVEGRTVVFVEVKTRQHHQAGHPLEAVDAEKQRRITRLALGYLRRHGLLEYPSRFDVVGITWPDGRGQPTIEHIKNAFEATGSEGMFS